MQVIAGVGAAKERKYSAPFSGTIACIALLSGPLSITDRKELAGSGKLAGSAKRCTPMRFGNIGREIDRSKQMELVVDFGLNYTASFGLVDLTTNSSKVSFG